MARTILHLNASARTEGSVSRDLTAQLVKAVSGERTKIISRDVGLSPLPLIDQAWVSANFTPEEVRTSGQDETLALSDTLIAELEAADTLVLGIPVYNFGVPAAFKAWIDLVARARKTFKYSETGPVGLLEGKKAYVVITSGGTQAGSAIDFAAPYVRHVLGFLGIHDVSFIAADQLMTSGPTKIAAAQHEIQSLVV